MRELSGLHVCLLGPADGTHVPHLRLHACRQARPAAPGPETVRAAMGADAVDSRSIRSTTVVAVRRDGRVAVAGDGQVTVGSTVLKHGARKVRRAGEGGLLG